MKCIRTLMEIQNLLKSGIVATLRSCTLAHTKVSGK
ncbi:hypothetical protein MiSe_44790 [Microseira wollei NIES-4236]|uniref:Uncharacterized protein n=1 Tax=Microseira wollei NIES-4236 TaxID=2530354 RepID=A0AAV3XA32_9CYAN|nr:hypothetical protein MiSe_44790 [Microseira wollei NIES-4236]